MASFGDTLKRERELREITLREISDATKVNIRYLEALEQNRFEILPGGLFNKGFIRAYATYVGLDCEEMVNAYLDEIAVRDSAVDAGQDPGPANVHRPSEAPRRRVAREPGGGGPFPDSSPLVHREEARSGLFRRKDRETVAEDSTAVPDPRPGLDPPTRVLASVFGLIAGISLIFVALSLFMPRIASRPSGSGPAGSATHPPPSDIPPVPDGVGVSPPEKSAVHDEGETTPQVASAAGGGGAAASESPGDRAGDPDESTLPDPVEMDASVTDAAPIDPEPRPTPAAALIEENGPMRVRLRTRDRTWVQLFCDGDEAINWVMRSGDIEEMECRETIRVSAVDASAVRLMVNGEKCLPLGEPGQRVYGYTLRIDDYHLACGRRRGSRDGR